MMTKGAQLLRHLPANVELDDREAGRAMEVAGRQDDACDPQTRMPAPA
jgi:hypothetical protein